MLAEGQVLEGRGQLIGLLHAGAHGADSSQHQHITGPDMARLDGGDGIALAGEDLGRAFEFKDTVGREHRGIDGRAFNHRTLGGDVAAREGHRAGQAALAGQRRRQDHRIGIDTVQLLQPLAEHRPALGPRPRLEGVPKPIARGRERLEIEQAEIAQMQHHFGHTTRQERPHRGVMGGTIGHHAHQTGRAAVDGDPIVHRGPTQTSRMGDGRDVQEQVRRTTKSRVHSHGIAQRGVSQHCARGQAGRLAGHERTRRIAGQLDPDGLAAGGQR